MKTLLLAAVVALGSGQMAAAGAPVTVHIKDFAYVQPTITVPVGTTVKFVNDDGEAHTVTAVDKSFDSTGLDTGNAWTYKFTKPGRYAYFCALHPYMKGTVVVKAADGKQ